MRAPRAWYRRATFMIHASRSCRVLARTEARAGGSTPASLILSAVGAVGSRGGRHTLPQRWAHGHAGTLRAAAARHWKQSSLTVSMSFWMSGPKFWWTAHASEGREARRGEKAEKREIDVSGGVLDQMTTTLARQVRRPPGVARRARVFPCALASDEGR